MSETTEIQPPCDICGKPVRWRETRVHFDGKVAHSGCYDLAPALASKDAEIERLREACRGGNAIHSTAELLEFLADRLVAIHGENDNTDYIRAANERAAMLRAALSGENV